MATSGEGTYLPRENEATRTPACMHARAHTHIHAHTYTADVSAQVCEHGRSREWWAKVVA